MLYLPPLLLLSFATVVDFRHREIPDWIPLALLAWAVGITALGVLPQGWPSLISGLVLGFVVGAFLFYLGGFGGGDAKLLIGLGALLGPSGFLALLFYVAVAGGLMAAVAALRGQRDLAYAPAMALGFLAFMMSRGVW